MEKWSWFGFLMLAATVSGKGILDLSGREEVNGTWKAFVVLPCAYEPSPGFRELSVAWKASQQEHGLRTLFHRDQSSGDQTLLTAFKGRLSVPRKPAGEVSLRIEALDMTDSGVYTCSVAWEAKNKSRISKERVTRLRVIKVPVTKPVIQSSSGAGAASAGAQTSLTCLTEGSPPIRYRWYKEQADGTSRFVDSEAVLTFNPLQASDAGRYSCTVGNRVTARVQRSETFELIVRGGSTYFNTTYPSILSEEPTTSRPETTKETLEARTTAGSVVWRRVTTSTAARTSSSTFGPHWKASERQGHRKAALPFYVIILIAVLVSAAVLSVIAIAFCRRRRTKPDRSYQVAYNNNDAAFVPGGGGGGGGGSEGPCVAPQPCEGPYEEPTRCLENNYTEEPTKAGPYVAMRTTLENEYELLVSKESEYEVTV
ncbi:V-set and immunoglobulin domain-containing protein 4 [Anolis carolinensis]|uniref:V-set and immunoglobulin domain-containing protein 4 n=1 Tax=Anolis carolinensis TaxID=28377 RepID=UPI002F2B7866